MLLRELILFFNKRTNFKKKGPQNMNLVAYEVSLWTHSQRRTSLRRRSCHCPRSCICPRNHWNILRIDHPPCLQWLGALLQQQQCTWEKLLRVCWPYCLLFARVRVSSLDSMDDAKREEWRIEVFIESQSLILFRLNPFFWQNLWLIFPLFLSDLLKKLNGTGA